MKSTKKVRLLFLLLVLTQGLHSIEEYKGQLWENFPPATYLCSLFSDDLETGFLIINIGLFVLGLLCWGYLQLGFSKFANGILWFWVILEIINGVGHPIWAFYTGSYTPGLYTAPLLLVLATLLYKAGRTY